MKFKSIALFLLLTQGLFAQSLQEGLVALDYNRYEQARNIFIKLTETEPTNGLNYYYLGQAYINLYKTDLAREAFSKGVNIDPNNPANYAGLGRLLLDDEKPAEAKVQFDKAITFGRAKDGRYKDVQSLVYTADAMSSADNKQLDEALKLINIALESNKKTYDMYIVAGDVYLELNDGGKSASMYEKAIDLEKSNPKAYVKVSEIWLRVKNAEATYTALKQATDLNSNYAPALKALAEYYYQTKNFEKAKTTFTKYLENSEPSLANKQRFARILYRSKEYKDALELINEILLVDKSDLYLYRLAAYCYYEQGVSIKDKDSATQLFTKGVELLNNFVKNIDPAKVISNDYEYLGKLYSRIPGNDSISIYYISKAIETDPTKLELIKEAANIYYKLKRFNEAVTYFEKYMSTASKITLVDYQLLGLSAYYSGQYNKCDSAYIKILEIKPDYTDGYYWRGLANSSLDPDYKETKAKENYEKFVSLAEATPEKYTSKLVVAYDYLGSYAITKDDNKLGKEYYLKVIKVDPKNQRALEILSQLK